MQKTISYRTFENYIKRVVNSNLDKGINTYTPATIENRSNAIIELMIDTKQAIVHFDWHDRVKQASIVHD